MSDNNRSARSLALVGQADNSVGQADNSGTGERRASKDNPPLSEAAQPRTPDVQQSPSQSSTPETQTQPQTEQPVPYVMRDLVAQEEMADASIMMGWAAIGTLAITAIGTFFLAWQVKLTRKAVEETGDATDAMLEANEIARDAQQRQLRAYLNAHDIAVVDFLPGRRPCFQFRPINSGQTPAYDVQCRMGLAWGTNIEPSDLRITLRDEESPRFSKAIIPPGLDPSFDFPKALVLGQAEYDAVMHGDLVFCFAGVLTYRDAFHKTHRTTFKHFLRPEFLVDGKTILSACSKGNRAN